MNDALHAFAANESILDVFTKREGYDSGMFFAGWTSMHHEQLIVHPYPGAIPF
jgi:hypothetical protein